MNARASGHAVESERERDLERLLTFVDAIAAIAITLLVLPLVDLTTGLTEDDSVHDLISDHWPQLWSFFLSFAVIARLWFAQHRAMRPVLRSHRHVSVLLVGWSLTIAFLPFPTALVAQAGEQTISKVLYIGTLIVSAGVLGLLDVVINRHPEITDGGGANTEAALMNVALLVAALVVTLVIPATSYWPLLLLVLDDPLRAALHRRLPRR